MENYTGIIIENKKAKIKALTKPASIRNKNYYYKKANLWNHFINRVEELENSYFNK